LRPAYRSAALAGAFLLAAAGLASAQAPVAAPAPAPKGYLSADQTAAIVRLVPPPPAAGSAREAADREVYERTRAWKDTGRWALAQDQAEIDPKSAGRFFDCALGFRTGPQQPPALTRLLDRTIRDVSVSYNPAKNVFKRPRPLVGNDLPICVTRDEALAKSYSYPSGHGAIGWAWGLILSEMFPDRASEILKVGLSLGEGRVVCGAHVPSDIEAGRTIGAAVVAAEHASPEFQRDLAEAKAELEALRARGGETNPRCAAEADALSKPAF
jgi:acid phosphatase (class A)